MVMKSMRRALAQRTLSELAGCRKLPQAHGIHSA